LHFYVQAAGILDQFAKADDPQNYPGFSNWLKTHIGGIENELDRTWQYFVDAASKGLIDTATLSVCRRKSQALEEVLESMHDKWNTPKRAKEWYVIH
jgi:hypothetical protein